MIYDAVNFLCYQPCFFQFQLATSQKSRSNPLPPLEHHNFVPAVEAPLTAHMMVEKMRLQQEEMMRENHFLFEKVESYPRTRRYDHAHAYSPSPTSHTTHMMIKMALAGESDERKITFLHLPSQEHSICFPLRSYEQITPEHTYIRLLQ
jgi:hypothetical protein